MKFKRFMFKVLRLKVLIPILIVIIAGVLLLAYFFGGIKATAYDTSDTNLSFNINDFTSYESKTYDAAEFQDLCAEIATGKYKTWIAQNDKYVMYMDTATTIVYVFQIEDDAIVTGQKQEGTDYPKIDITKCKICYQSAKENYTGAEGANFLLSYADSTTGNTLATEFNTMTNSVFYTNSLTGEIEQHYYLKNVDNGIQVFYGVGAFSAGDAYFPTKFYQTIYKPYYGTEEDEKSYCALIKEYEEKVAEAEDEKELQKWQTKLDNEKKAWETHVNYWISYMKMLGLEDPMNASDYEINCALANTYEQRFRGNALFKMNATTNTATKTATWEYSGTVDVYTEAGYNHMLELAKANKITFDEVSFRYDEGSTSSPLMKYGNAKWTFKGVSENFFEGEGTFYNCEESPIIVNTCIPSKFFESDLGYGNNGSTYTVTNENDDKDSSPYNFYLFKDKIAPYVKTAVFNMIYKTGVWEDPLNKYVYKNKQTGEEYQCGGFLKFEDGKYVYGNDGKIEKTFYSLETVANDNDMFGIVTQTSLAIFGFAVEFKLTKNGLQTTILADSMVDYSNASSRKEIKFTVGGELKSISDINKKYELLNITVLPQMTTTISPVNDPVNGDEGYILVPDGSGAIINFGNGKYELGYEGVNKIYYGTDNAFATKAQPEDTKDLMLGMFGYVCTTAGKERGVIGVIEKGGSQNTLLANTDQFKNYTYFKLCVRRNQEVKIGKGSGARPFYKLAKNLADIDAQYLYMFLSKDELDYSSIANKYQNYLIERDYGEGTTVNSVEKDTTRNTVVDLNFIGSFEKYALFLGFKYKTPDSLTTFEQAEEIITELTETGVDVGGTKTKINDYSVTYTSWTNEELEYDLGGKIKVSSILGGLSSMEDFVSFLNSNGKSLYLETKITSTKDYDYSFGKLKYNARNVANEVATVYDYDPSTLRQSKKLSATNYINPIYFINITNYVVSQMEKINKKTDADVAYYLNDLGNKTTNSYKSYEEVYGQKTIEYQVASLKALKDTGAKVKIEAPYDYAFKYIDEATNIPMTSTLAPIYDETIPFYQLVISGLFDYTTEDINGTSNNSAEWFYSKAVETGSNLSFVISAENPSILLDTDYTYYYQSYYQNWKETIVTFASKIDAIGIHKGQLVNHQSIGKNVSFVQYKLYDGTGYINLCVNTTEKAFTVQNTIIAAQGVTIPAGTVIPAYGYYKIG